MPKKDGWQKKNNYYLILYNGNIINLDEKNTNIIEFKKSEFNLSKYGTKSTIFPKMQETNSLKLIQCLNSFVNYNTADEFNLVFMEQFFKCDKTSINSVFQEEFKRLMLPFFIIVSSFIAGC